MRLAGTSGIAAANAFIPAFMEACNRSFASPAQHPRDLLARHRAWLVELLVLRDLYCSVIGPDARTPTCVQGSGVELNLSGQDAMVAGMS